MEKVAAVLSSEVIMHPFSIILLKHVYCCPKLAFVLLVGSPFKVPVKDVVDPSKVKIAGPGLGTAVRARLPQVFTVDTSKAGVAPLEVTVAAIRGRMFLSIT